MKTLKTAGRVLLLMQCSLNILTVAVFLFAPGILRPNGGSFSMLGRILIFGGGFLSILVVGIFGYATQREQNFQEASEGEPEGGKIAQRDLTLCIVGFSSECLTLYWIFK